MPSLRRCISANDDDGRADAFAFRAPMDGRLAPAAGDVRPPQRARRLRCRLCRHPHRRGEPRLVEQALTVLRNLEHRGATGAEPDSGDGAGILLQVPDAFLREAVGTFELPAAGQLRRRHRLPARRATRTAPRRVDAIERIAAEEGLTVLGWREVPVAPRPARRHRPLDHAVLPPALRRRRAPARRSGIELDRLAFVLRKRAEREADVYFPSLSARTIVYKGMLTTGQLEPFFPDLSDRAVRHRHRAGPLPLLHQHLPELAAGPPVPLRRAQRRDQHRPGQPQLDAGPRVAAGQRPDPAAGPGAALPDLHARRLRLRLLRRGAGAAPPRRPLAAARRADDDPRGVGEPHRDGPGPARLLPVPLHADGALGRPGLRHLHRRHR